jgi:hypothetical protein
MLASAPTEMPSGSNVAHVELADSLAKIGSQLPGSLHFHAYTHDAASAARGEEDLIAAQLWHGLVQQHAHPTHSTRHAKPLSLCSGRACMTRGELVKGLTKCSATNRIVNGNTRFFGGRS